MKLAILLLSQSLTAATLLFTSATADTGQSPVSLSDSASGTFELLVTGRSGSGMFMPEFTLEGVSNARTEITTLEQFGGIAAISWPVNISVGDPTGPAESNPAMTCPCGDIVIPFTFGTPQQFSVTITATAVVEGSGPFSGFTTWAEFDDGGELLDLSGNRIAGSISIFEVAEAPACLMVGVPLGILVFVKRVFREEKSWTS